MTEPLLCIALLLGLAVAAVPLGRAPIGRPLIYGASLLICLVLLKAGIVGIAATPETLALPLGLPGIGTHFRLDPLSATFLVLLGLGGAGASLFALGYGRHEAEPQRVLPFYPVFLAGMAMVLLADDAFLFLFSWELMSLASWALVMAQHREAGTRQAGYVYIVMATASGVLLLLAFGLLAGPDSSYLFDTMRGVRPAPGFAALIFMLALAGAGAKAGLVPLHVWLPLAHPAAPTPVSALMSSVMTKVAVYGFIRITFDLLGATLWWQAVLVLALGGITAVLGVLHAVLERDLKRLLAYSTIENIGIIFIGLGLALAFRANDFAAGAALALTAALLHALNHTLFKSLLFFGAGAVVTATGTRDLERLGGLIHRMPTTAFAVLVGCFAISALPPLNGFVSEWLTFQAILLRPDLPQWGLKIMIPVDGALLALAAALAACCFVRAFGIGFLGRARSVAAEQAQETDGFSRAAMLISAALCLFAGVLPGVIIDRIAPVTDALLLAHVPGQTGNDWLTLAPVASARGSYNGLLVFGFIAAAAWLSALVVHRFGSRALQRGAAWDCGFPDAGVTSQYTAASFAQPIRRVFGTTLFGASDTVDMPAPGDMRAASIVHQIGDPTWETLYTPLGRVITAIADRLNVLQFLTIRRYLGFVFATLVVLLLALALWQ